MCSADLAIPGYRSRESGGADYELQNKNHRLTYERGHLHLYLSSSPHHPGCTGIFYVRSRKSSEHFKKDRFQIYPRHLSYIREEADVITWIAHEYTKRCLFDRNYYMVSHCSVLLACFDGQPGGTARTIETAHRLGRLITVVRPVRRKVA